MHACSCAAASSAGPSPQTPTESCQRLGRHSRPQFGWSLHGRLDARALARLSSFRRTHQTKLPPVGSKVVAFTCFNLPLHAYNAYKWMSVLRMGTFAQIYLQNVPWLIQGLCQDAAHFVLCTCALQAHQLPSLTHEVVTQDLPQKQKPWSVSVIVAYRGSNLKNTQLCGLLASPGCPYLLPLLSSPAYTAKLRKGSICPMGDLIYTSISGLDH